MVEVFTTNVQEISHAEALIQSLLLHFPDCQINFDLEDCDKILRVEGNCLPAEKVVLLMRENGFACEILA